MIIQTAVMLEQERAMEVRSSNNIEASPMELYIHIPFCIRKCDYCDFLSGPSDPGKRAAYVQALLKEIQAVKEGRGRSVSSIFIGGGTPSVLDEKFMGEILREIRKDFKLQEDAEITIEVNPGTVDARKLQAYRSFGINRLSIGLQSPQDRELKILGRIHNYRQFLETYKQARDAGFDNINVDLMSAIPEQTYEDWIGNLRTVAELGPEHISAYAGVRTAGFTGEHFQEMLRKFNPENGRMEQFRIKGTGVTLNLAKNPAGFNQNISAVMQDPSPKDIIIAINDNAQDGTDISWLWDVDFDLLGQESIKSITVSGIRCQDMRLRLKYVDIPSMLEGDVEKAVRARVEDGVGNLYVLVNYTALFSTRNILKKLEGEKS